MCSREIEIKNTAGLHARPASAFVHLAGGFQSEIELRRVGEESRYNAKSIIMLLALGLGQGERAVLTAHGPDEREAVEALAALWTASPTMRSSEDAEGAAAGRLSQQSLSPNNRR